MDQFSLVPKSFSFFLRCKRNYIHNNCAHTEFHSGGGVVQPGAAVTDPAAVYSSYDNLNDDNNIANQQPPPTQPPQQRHQKFSNSRSIER